MLKIINSLAPFFEDCYRSISVREYARLIGVSPPTASKMLKGFAREGYVQHRKELGHLFFMLNIENEEVIDISRCYWKIRLTKLTAYVVQKLTGASGVLFGSLAKAEVTATSDVDLAIFAPEKKQLDMAHFEKVLGRRVSLHWFKSLRDMENENLLNNVLNGVILFGRVKW